MDYNAWRPRATAAMVLLGCAVQMKGLGSLEISVDGGLEVDDCSEHAAFQSALGERGEERLDCVEPGARGRRSAYPPPPRARSECGNTGLRRSRSGRARCRACPANAASAIAARAAAPGARGKRGAHHVEGPGPRLLGALAPGS